MATRARRARTIPGKCVNRAVMDEAANAVFAALADPTRRRVLRLVAERGPASATLLKRELSVSARRSQSTWLCSAAQGWSPVDAPARRSVIRWCRSHWTKSPAGCGSRRAVGHTPGTLAATRARVESIAFHIVAGQAAAWFLGTRAACRDVAGLARVRERVVLVRYHPAVVHLAQTNGEPQSVLGIALEVRGRAASQQSERERDVRTGRDVQRFDLEYRSGGLPLEEAGPGVAVRVKATDATLRRRNVEHDDVRGMVVQHCWEVAGVNGGGPALDQFPNLLFVGHDSSRIATFAHARGSGVGLHRRLRHSICTFARSGFSASKRSSVARPPVRIAVAPANRQGSPGDRHRALISVRQAV